MGKRRTKATQNCWQVAEDERASLLLKRLRVAREAETKKPKIKRMPKSKFKSVETLEELERLVHDLGRKATPERLLVGL